MQRGRTATVIHIKGIHQCFNGFRIQDLPQSGRPGPCAAFRRLPSQLPRKGGLSNQAQPLPSLDHNRLEVQLLRYALQVQHGTDKRSLGSCLLLPSRVLPQTLLELLGG